MLLKFSFIVLLLLGVIAPSRVISAEATPAKTPVVVRLGYFPNVTHAQALIGLQQGDFAQAFAPEATVQGISFNAGPSVIEAIFAGELDIAYIGPSPMLNGYIKSEGQEVRLIAGAATNGVVIVGNKKLGITSVEQLRGGRVATPQLGNTQDVAAKFFLPNRFGFTLGTGPGETQIIPISNPDVEILFQKDQLEGAWLPEPWASRLIESGLATQLAAEQEFWPEQSFALTGVIARKQFLDEHPELIARFLKAHEKITTELAESPNDFIEPINAEIARLTGKTLPEKVLKRALKNVGFSTDLNRNTYTASLEMGQQLGFLKTGSVSLEGLFAETLAESNSQPLLEPAARRTAAAFSALALSLLFFTLLFTTSRLSQPLFVGGLVSAWYFVAALQLFPRYLFPGPVDVLESFWTLLQNGSLVKSLAYSLGRMGIGYSISVVAGLSLGALIAASPKAKQTIGALVLSLQSLPSICWLPFALLWVGLNERAILVVIVLGALFSIAVTTENALRNIPPIYARVGRTLGARYIVLAKDILFFAALPEILGGLKVGWTFAWRSLMAAELIRSDVVGVGHLLEVGRQFNDISQMLAAITVILLIGISVDRLVFGTIQNRVRRRWGLEKSA